MVRIAILKICLSKHIVHEHAIHALELVFSFLNFIVVFREIIPNIVEISFR